MLLNKYLRKTFFDSVNLFFNIIFISLVCKSSISIANVETSPSVVNIKNKKKISKPKPKSNSNSNSKKDTQKSLDLIPSSPLNENLINELTPLHEEISSHHSTDVADMIYPHEIGKDISEAVVLLANRLDSFFGEARGDDEKNGSTLRITPSVIYFNDRKPIYEFGFNLNLKFKNLETKAKKIEKKIQDEIDLVTKDQNEEKKSEIKNVENAMDKVEQEEWNYNFESKILVKPAIYYSGKFRVRRDFLNQTFFLHHFALSAGWDTDDAWSQLTSLNSDHAITENVLFRFSNEINWYISNNSFQTYHGPTIFQTVNKYNSVSYSFRGVFGVVNGNYQRLDSPLAIDWRHGTPSKRIYIDFIPMLSYPFTKSYKEVKSFQIKFEYLFGDIN